MFATALVDASDVDGMSQTVECRAGPLQAFPVAQVGPRDGTPADVIHVLSRREQLEVFDDVRVPSRHVASQLFEHRRRAFAAAERKRVRHLGSGTADARDASVQRTIAD